MARAKIMGNNQSTGSNSNWSTDNIAYGTGPNAISIEDVLDEVQQIPEKYFGGQAVENDSSMHQMQQDLLAFDETLITFFRQAIAKKWKNTNDKPKDEHDSYQVEKQSSRDSEENHQYLEPISIIGIDRAATTTNTSMNNSQRYSYWRCGNCTTENKIGERVCQRCKQAETRF